MATTTTTATSGKARRRPRKRKSRARSKPTAIALPFNKGDRVCLRAGDGKTTATVIGARTTPDLPGVILDRELQSRAYWPVAMLDALRLHVSA